MSGLKMIIRFFINYFNLRSLFLYFKGLGKRCRTLSDNIQMVLTNLNWDTSRRCFGPTYFEANATSQSSKYCTFLQEAIVFPSRIELETKSFKTQGVMVKQKIYKLWNNLLDFYESKPNKDSFQLFSSLFLYMKFNTVFNLFLFLCWGKFSPHINLILIFKGKTKKSFLFLSFQFKNFKSHI